MDTAHKIGAADTWQQRIDAVRSPTGIGGIADAVMERWFARDFRERRRDELAGWRNMLTRTPVEGYAAVCAAIRDATSPPRRRPCACRRCAWSARRTGPRRRRWSRSSRGSSPAPPTSPCRRRGHLPCVEQPEDVARAVLEFAGENGLA
jgi:hypothetical protein